MENNLCGVFGDHCARQGAAYGIQGRGPLQSSYRFVTGECAVEEPPDYAAEHDSFLDALLHEQQQFAAARRKQEASSLSTENHHRSSSSITSIHSASSWTLSPTSLSSNSSMVSETSSRKRQRPVRLHRRSSTSPIRRRGSCSSSSNSVTGRGKRRGQLNRADTVNLLEDLGETQPPAHFVHSQCRMQKDKGKGDPVGSNICARGVPACLEKLRAKMQLLTEHCLEEGSSATMKRRKAVVTADNDNFVETRSLLTLRMGFLSMTYGVLLRWDTGRSGKVSLVVLRKNCHESFYKQRSSLKSSTSASSLYGQLPLVSPSSSMTSEDDEEGLEVAILDPPYLVPRPVAFAPSEISVSVLHATGLDQKSHWTVQLQLADQTENILLAHDHQTQLMVPKLGDALTREIPDIRQDPGVLEIKLLEHKVRRKQRVLRCSMRVPCSSLEAQSSESALPVTMRIPCPDGATIQIEAVLCSDELLWRQRELEARRRSRKKSRTAGSNNTKVNSTTCEPCAEDMSSPWDWICMVC